MIPPQVQAGPGAGLDEHLAELLQRLAAGRIASQAAVALLGRAGQAVSRAAAAGHPCCRVADVPGLSSDPDCSALLTGTGLVGDGRRRSPLVLDGQGRLYLWRFWQAQENLAGRLCALNQPVADLDVAALRTGLDRLFPRDEAPERPDRQRLAAAVAASRRLAIITGGPGTGKTTTVLRILALLLEGQGDGGLRIGLAAPTGKAAARLRQALRTGKAREQAAGRLDPRLACRIPDEAATLHRLLGLRPDRIAARHHREHPLPLDVLVVDEASMIGMGLMSRLVDALAPPARLILLGDRDQLASVEPGAVLADLCQDSDGLARGQAVARDGALVDGLPESPPMPGSAPLNRAVVALRHSHRFGSGSGIGRLARAVNDGDAAGVRRILEQGDGDLAVMDVARVADYVADRAGPWLDRLRNLPLPAEGLPEGDAGLAEVFRAFESFRCLSALRQGSRGVAGLNVAITARLTARGQVPGHQLWYAGRPVMVLGNDYARRLFNGDVGLVWPRCDGGHGVVFPGQDGGYVRHPVTALPEAESAWCSTVHKSQGSEFDEVLLVLPAEADSPVLSRELIYTAITRARKRFVLAGDPAVLAAALDRRTRRVSGLADALRRRSRSVSSPTGC